jgi:hypothetical protein
MDMVDWPGRHRRMECSRPSKVRALGEIVPGSAARGEGEGEEAPSLWWGGATRDAPASGEEGVMREA